jgi:SAM-dependent methyltransferase
VAAPTRPGAGEFEDIAPYYDELMSRVPYRHWVDYVERLVGLVQVPTHRVLDLACGTGRVGSELRRRGYRVVGADLSFPMTQLCARREPPLPAAVMDAAALGLRPASLDLVVCLYDSLNYVLDPRGLQECFRRVREALAPGGRFIFDLNTPRALRIGLFTQHDLDPAARMNYRWEAHWDEARQLCRVDMWFLWRGAGGPQEFEEVHYERAYEQQQVLTWLNEAGFATVRSYDAYTLNPVGPLSERMFFVAQA